MLKNLFKAAKKALKNPIVQLGIGALVPGMAAGMAPGLMRSVLTNPALLQGGIGLLSGDKPENVARNIGIQALLGGFRGMQDPSSTFGEGVKRTFTSQPTYTYRADEGRVVKDPSVVDKVIEGATSGEGIFGTGISQDTALGLAQLAMPFIAASQMKDDQIQVDPQAISGLDLSNYLAEQAASQYQATGGITGFARGGADPTNGMNQVSYGSTMGEPNGLFTGPGGPKEDKIDVMLSPGEFVVTAEATKKIGVDNLYDMMNKVDPDSERPDEYRERVGMA